ncbi:MAG: helix-turn-helix domain-containing protein [Lewinellaceae bacterium]|nr:helix-turn-helix domain-containing protein [Lewinellaceae bacterium]
MPIICLESEAFKALVKEVHELIKKEEHIEFNTWIDGKEAMKLLRITSKTTFQKYRDSGKIEYRRIDKHILYRRRSIMDFIENSSKT